jgi:hypothetical protein
MAFSERICSNSLRWFGTKKVVLEDFLESDSDREFLLVGQKKEKKKTNAPQKKETKLGGQCSFGVRTRRTKNVRK